MSSKYIAGIASDDTMIRIGNETLHIYQYQIETISDSLFLEAFRDNLLRKEIKTHDEVMCEKFFLMLNHPKIEVQQVAIDFYLTHVDEESFADCMENVYNFSRADFYEVEVNRGVMAQMQKVDNSVNTVLAYVRSLKLKENTVN